MTNFATNFAGYGAVVAESIVATGNIEAQGQFLAKAGTQSSPGYAFKDGANYGFFLEVAGSRFASTAAGGETMYFGSAANHSYKPASIAGVLNVSGGNLVMGTGRKLILDTSTSTSDLALQFNGDPNTGFYRDAADDYRLVVGGSAVQAMAASTVITLGNHYFNNALRIVESSVPAATANQAWIYAIDVGTKTQLTTKLGAAGTVVALGIEV